MNKKVLLCAALCLVVAVAASPAVDETPNQNSVHVNEHESSSVEEALLKKLNGKCTNHDVSSCMMLKLVTYFNRLLKKSQIAVGDFEITQTATETINVNAARSLQDVEKMSEESQFTTVLADKALSFLRTRSLKWKVLDEAEVVISGKDDQEGGINLGLSLRPVAADSSSEGEARKKSGGGGGGGKKGGGMGAMIAAIALKIGLLKALAFKALVLLVGKALLVSKLALVLAAVIGLKKLFSQEKHVTYEVVAQPNHETHHEHVSSHDSYGGGGGGGGGGWGRNYETANNLAYRAHVPKN